MSRYIAKPVSESVWHIRQGGRKIGDIITRAGNRRDWRAKIGEHVGTGRTVREAFDAVITIVNRIELCGENDPVKARKALDQRNREIEARNEARRIIEQPMVDAVERFARAAGLPMMPRRRPRRKRILI